METVLEEGIVEMFELPKYIRNKSFAQAAEEINKRFGERNDKASLETKQELLGRLAEAQEYIKEYQERQSDAMETNSQEVPDMMDGQIPEGAEEFMQDPTAQRMQQGAQMGQGMQQPPSPGMMSQQGAQIPDINTQGQQPDLNNYNSGQPMPGLKSGQNPNMFNMGGMLGGMEQEMPMSEEMPMEDPGMEEGGMEGAEEEIMQIAEMHGVEPELVAEQLELGMQIEMQQVENPEEAQIVVLQNLAEDPGFYAEMEGEGMGDEELMEPGMEQEMDPSMMGQEMDPGMMEGMDPNMFPDGGFLSGVSADQIGGGVEGLDYLTGLFKNNPGLDTSGRSGKITGGPSSGSEIGGGAIGGLGTGAKIGTSIMPGLGTAIGAGVGLIGGGLSGLVGSNKRKRQQAEANQNADLIANSQFQNYAAYGGKVNKLLRGGRPELSTATSNFFNPETIDLNRSPINNREHNRERLISPSTKRIGVDAYAPQSTFNKYLKASPSSTIPNVGNNSGRNTKQIVRDFNKTAGVPTKFGEITNKAGELGKKGLNWMGENYGDILMTAPIIKNLLSKNKLDSTPRGTRLDDRYSPNLPDINAITNEIRSINSNRAVAERSGGNLGSAMANTTAQDLGTKEAIGRARLGADQMLAQDSQFGQQFNMGVNQANMMQDERFIEREAQDRGAFNTAESARKAALAEDIAAFGKERVDEDIVANMFGYTRKGKYLVDKKGNKISQEELERISKIASVFRDPENYRNMHLAAIAEAGKERAKNTETNQ